MFLVVDIPVFFSIKIRLNSYFLNTFYRKRLQSYKNIVYLKCNLKRLKF